MARRIAVDAAQSIKRALGQTARGVQPAYVETVRIFNVNIDDWSVDCISEHGNKRYFDVQVMSPYFHYMNGEGIYTMPEAGALAWLCVPSTGKMAAPFLLGYQAPFDETDANYSAGRQNLNPGDMMFRTRDENFIILRRGGVVQIGATPIAQRLYVPIRNFIKDFCENYQLTTFGGEMFWETQRDDQRTDGAAPTKFYLKSKQKANDPQHIAELTMGSHGEDDPLTMELTIWTDGTDSREAVVRLQITNEGDVTWDIEKDWTQNVTGNYSLSVEGDHTTDVQGSLSASSQGNASVDTEANLSLSASSNAELKAGTVATVDAPMVKLGSGATSQAVRGTELFTALTQFATSGAAASTGTLLPLQGAFTALAGSLSSILSSKVKVE